jgi:hypothetical protein
MRKQTVFHGAAQRGMRRRSFLAGVGGTALGGCALAAKSEKRGEVVRRVKPALPKKELTVQPAFVYSIPRRRHATSWRPWGGIMTESDAQQEIRRIEYELQCLTENAEFPVKFLPVAKVRSKSEAAALCKAEADVMLIYGATGGTDTMEALISPDRHNLVFVRHRSGPVYLWYEIVHPRLLRKTVDHYGQPGLEPYDVVVDDHGDVLWRLRALYALKNSVGSRMIAIGGPSGWGAGGQEAPRIAAEKWKMDIQTVPYSELDKMIQSARANPERVRRTEAEAEKYLAEPGISLRTDKGFVTRAFLLNDIFEELMAQADAQAITVNGCMGTIIPKAETTACLPLSLINDSGALAFCESDFAVIPSGVLLHHIAGTPVFLQDPTYPHHGVVTVAHCTAPRKMDGVRSEETLIVTHFESDYGAAPKVNMRIGQEITMIDPDFGDKRWIGFRGTIVAHPFHAICRSQIDVAIDGDWRKLMEEMVGFHWMLAYGDHLKETGYALRKLGIDWYNLTGDRTAEC